MRKPIIVCTLVAVLTMGAWPETSSRAGPPDPFADDASRSPCVASTFTRRPRDNCPSLPVGNALCGVPRTASGRLSCVSRNATEGVPYGVVPSNSESCSSAAPTQPTEEPAAVQELRRQLLKNTEQAHEALQRKEEETAAILQKLALAQKRLAEQEGLSSARRQEDEKKIAVLSEKSDRLESTLDAMLEDLAIARPAAMRRWLVRLVTRHDLPSSYLVRLLNDRDGRVRTAAASALRRHDPLVARHAGLAPWEAPPWPADDRMMTAGEKNIRRALNHSGGPVEFIECPFLHVIEFFRDYFEIGLMLDTPALEKAGVDLDSPIDLNVQVTTLRSALRLVVEQFDPALTYTVRDDVVLITTVEGSLISCSCGALAKLVHSSGSLSWS